MRFFKFWAKGSRAGQNHDAREIKLEENGFTVAPLPGGTEETVSVKWQSVIEAVAFKRDLFSTDRVCIAFHLEDESGVEVHEEMKSFVELCEALPDHLPDAPKFADWFMEITTPAFEPKPTLLFRRQLGRA